MSTGRRIFLAHAREDKARVRALYADLKARRLDPWLDEIDLMPGLIWKEEISKAICQAGVFLACLSSRSVSKVGYVQNEFRLALSAFGERPSGSIFLIPVRLDECDVPDLQIPDRGLSLRDIHWVDLWQEGGFDRLVSAIDRSLGLTTLPQAPPHDALTAIPSPQVPERVFEVVKDSDTQHFIDDVVQASREQPVIVDFWAPWCGPCKQLGPILERMVRAAGGKVRLVKINIDESPELAQKLRIKSIPMVYGFVQGQPVDGFAGVLPESTIKEFVERLPGLLGPSS